MYLLSSKLRLGCINSGKRVVDCLKNRFQTKPILIPNQHYCTETEIKNMQTDVMKHLQKQIKFGGPITIADYMKEVLIHPTGGYYTNKDNIIGRSGDFITSPEISQMFGELIAVWCIHEWLNLGSPKPLQIVELGPGKGTLMDDMCRVFSKFFDITEGLLSVHLVDLSRTLVKMQEKKLCGNNKTDVTSYSDLPYFNKNLTKYGIPVYWYTNVEKVPENFTIYIAHEFLDALPIHKFQKVKDKWHEVLIDIDDANINCLRYVLSHGPTPNSQSFVSENETREHVEVSTEAAILAFRIAERMEANGGFALFIDYGHDGIKTDTFRAFKQHDLHDPLCEPGTADLTADVDFSFIRKTVQKKAITFGPVNQATFLKRMEIEARLERLLQANPNNTQELLLGYQKLTSVTEMGERYKAFSMFPSVIAECNPNFRPVGF